VIPIENTAQLKILFLALLVNALAQAPTGQMIAIQTMARSHSVTNAFQYPGKQIENGKTALKNVLAWMALNAGYGKIPDGWSGSDYAIRNLMSKADYDALLAEGPYAFARLIDADQRSGANRFGIKRIRESSAQKTNNCPRGALIVMARDPAQVFGDGDILVCHDVGTTSHYNGYIRALNVDNSQVVGMFAPVSFQDNVAAMGAENNQLPSETQNSVPTWATALIVLGCVFLLALVVIAVLLARITKKTVENA